MSIVYWSWNLQKQIWFENVFQTPSFQWQEVKKILEINGKLEIVKTF